MALAQLDLTTLALLAEIRDRYELSLRPGKTHITTNEIAGIIARNLNLQGAVDQRITLTCDIDSSDLERRLKAIAEIAREVADQCQRLHT